MLKIKEKCNEIAELLELKNKMYGNSFQKTLKEYGKSIICIRIEDKLNRLKEIIMNNANAECTDEKMNDTLKDLAGYAVLALSCLEDENGR